MGQRLDPNFGGAVDFLTAASRLVGPATDALNGKARSTCFEKETELLCLVNGCYDGFEFSGS
jgi:hypothetical protein